MVTERTAMVATLIRITRDWDLAEDCVQDALETAIVRWPVEGVPRTPGAWLTTVARNRALDVLRRRQTERSKLAEVAMVAALEREEHDESADDDRLRLIFTCCHPALPIENRVALTLKTVAGLSTLQIARAFLTTEATLSQRLLRAKRKIANAAIPYRVPADNLLAERTGGVLAVVYLIFNAGYDSPGGGLAEEPCGWPGCWWTSCPRRTKPAACSHCSRSSTPAEARASTPMVTLCRWRNRTVGRGIAN